MLGGANSSDAKPRQSNQNMNMRSASSRHREKRALLLSRAQGGVVCLRRPSRRTSRSCVLREMPDVKRICYKLGLWVCSLSPRERAQAGHFCPAYASRNPCSFMNHKQGSGGWALLASARSLSAESGNGIVEAFLAGRACLDVARDGALAV